MKRIVIEVTRKEMGVLAHYALKLAARNLNESGGWYSASRLLREAEDTVYFQVDDRNEENELKQQGVHVKNGMAFMDPRRAVNMMNSMAQDDSQFKDVPTIMSLVRKIAARLGRPAPKVVGAGQGTAGNLTHRDVDPAAQHPGVDQAKYAPVEQIPDLQSQEEFERMQQYMYSPTAQAHGLQPQPPPAAPALTPAPGTMGTFQPRPRITARVKDVPEAGPGEETEDPRQWASEFATEPTLATTDPEAWKAARREEDVSQLAGGVQHQVPQGAGAAIPRGATAQDPKQQQRTAETEAQSQDFADMVADFDSDDGFSQLSEAYRLLGIRRPRWRVRNV